MIYLLPVARGRTAIIVGYGDQLITFLLNY